MIFSVVCAVVQIILWWLYKYNVVENFVNKLSDGKYGEGADDLLKDCIDVLPCILVIQYHNPLSLFFLLGCMIADKFIDDSMAVGGVMFLITYGLTSLSRIAKYEFNVIYWISAVLFILVAMIVIFSFLKGRLIEKIASACYGFTSLVLCIVAFLYTHNLGFVCLVIGDILLVVREIFKQNNSKTERFVMSVSNSFYYAGLCFVPLALV